MSRAHAGPTTQVPAAGAESAEEAEGPEGPEDSGRPPHRRGAVNRTRAAVRSALRLLLDAALVGLVAGVVAGFVGRWDPALWREYFDYQGDTFFNATNGALANPLGLTDVSPRLGWPYGLDMTDFPAGEPLFTWFQWLAHRVIDSDFTVLAVMWFLGFILVGAVTYLCLRGIGVGRWPAVVTALVFDFVPYHTWRATGHTNLAMFMAVPLGGMVLLWVMAGRLDLSSLAELRTRPIWRRPEWLAAAVAIVVLAVSARYYAVFFLLLLGAVAVGRVISRRDPSVAYAPILLAVGTLALALLTGVPQILQHLKNGGNAEVAQRPRLASDLYGLRLTDLLAPIPTHYLPALADWSRVMRNTVTRGEDGSSLGFFLVAGFVFLLLVAIVRPATWRAPAIGPGSMVQTAVNAALIGGLAFLIGTVGGLGGVIASLGYTQIRGWGRISIYIAFCAAVGLALALGWLWTLRSSPVRWRRLVPRVLSPLLLAAAVLDQTGITVPSQEAVAAKRTSDVVFFNAMADTLGNGAAVFQLPYVPFPESGVAAVDYAGFRGFLNDGGRLNYSYGGMRGRESDWQRSWTSVDLDMQVVGLAAAGWSAIVVDREGYPSANTIEPRLASLVGPVKDTSPDGRFAWYDLREVRQRVLAARGREWVQAVGAEVMRPIGVQVVSSAYRTSGTDPKDFGTIGATTTIALQRYDDDTRPVDVGFRVRTEAGTNVVASSGQRRETQRSSGDFLGFEQEISLEQRGASVVITTDAPNTATLTDPRPDIRGDLSDLRVLDAELSRRMAAGELAFPR